MITLYFSFLFGCLFSKTILTVTAQLPQWQALAGESRERL